MKQYVTQFLFCGASTAPDII